MCEERRLRESAAGKPVWPAGQRQKSVSGREVIPKAMNSDERAGDSVDYKGRGVRSPTPLPFGKRKKEARKHGGMETRKSLTNSDSSPDLWCYLGARWAAWAGATGRGPCYVNCEPLHWVHFLP